MPDDELSLVTDPVSITPLMTPSWTAEVFDQSGATVNTRCDINDKPDAHAKLVMAPRIDRYRYLMLEFDLVPHCKSYTLLCLDPVTGSFVSFGIAVTPLRHTLGREQLLVIVFGELMKHVV